VASVLLVLQAAAGVLGALGVLALMRNPLYLVVPLGGAVGQLVLARFVGRGSRWGWAVLIAVEGWQLLALALNEAVGLLPQVDLTLTLTGLLTRVGLPVALVCLGVLSIMRLPAVRRG
jgi:hypothetical protein